MAEDKPYITKIYENLQAAYPESFKRTPEEFEVKMKDEKYRKGVYENLQVAYPETFKRTPEEFDSLLTVTEKPAVPDNIDFAAQNKPKAAEVVDNIDFAANPKRGIKVVTNEDRSILDDNTTKNAIKVTSDNFKSTDDSGLDFNNKRALLAVMPTMPVNVLLNRKSREVFYNTYAQKQNVDITKVRDLGERIAANRVLELAQDAIVHGDLETAKNLATSQLKTRRKDAQAILNRLELPQVGSGSYRQPDYTPSTSGFSGKQGFTIEGENANYKDQTTAADKMLPDILQPKEHSYKQITPDTQPTASSKYLSDIAATLRVPTDAYGKYVIDPASEMIKHGAEKMDKADMTVYGLSNKMFGLAEIAMGAAGIGSAGGQAFTAGLTGASEVAPEATKMALWGTNYLAPYLNEKFGIDEEQAQNAGLTADILTAVILHGTFTKAKEAIKNAKGVASIKGMTPAELDAEAVKVLNSVPKEEFHKIVDESVSAFQKDPEAFKANVEATAEEVSNQAQEARDIQDGVDTHANTPDYEPIPHPESLGSIPEGYDVEYQGRKGTIDRGDDGTWYFNDDATGKSEQIPVKDKFNPQETLNDLGIQILPEVPQEQVAKAMADAERTGWVEHKGKRYFVSLGNPKIEGSYDMVFEQTPDGKLVNRFDSHPDKTFAQNRKLKIANILLEEQGLPKRESLRMPKQSEPTVVESATPKPVSEEVAVQETPAGEAAEVVQESPQAEAAEIKPQENALQVESASSVLQHPQEGVGETRSERVGMEPSEQGETPTVEGTEQPTSAKEEVVEAVTPEVEETNWTEDEIQAAYDEREKELKAQKQTGRGYKEEIIRDNLGRIRKEDYDRYGDKNHYRGVGGKMNPKWKFVFAKDSNSVLPLDVQAMNLSEIAGVEITIQDIVDFLQQKEANPTKAARKVKAMNTVANLPVDAKNVLEIIGAEDRIPTVEEVEALRGFPLDDAQADSLIQYIKDNEPKTDTQPNEGVAETPKPSKRSPEVTEAKKELGEIKKATKELADFLRKGKINRPDSFAANTPGSIVWDGAIEIAAKTIEAGGDVAQAVADAIKHLKESEWYQGLEKSRQLKAQQDLTGFIKQEKQEQFPLGIKNASTKAENAYLGIDQNTELTAEQKRDVKTVQENAKRFVEQGGDPEVLINKTIEQRSQLNAEELSVILDHKVKLGAEIKGLSDKLIDAYANGDKATAQAMEQKLQTLTDQFEKANMALEVSGYEQGLAFRMRQIMKNEDYTLAESERQWKVAAKGKEMPVEVREKFIEIENKLAESQKRLDALDRANQRLKTERAVQNIAAKTGRAGDKLRALAVKIESGKINKLQGFRSSSGFDLAWDASLKVIAESLKGGAELADAIEAGLKRIRETDWYKNLTDKKDFEQKYEDHINKEYAKAEYEAAYYDEKGKLKISKALIKDIVREGIQTPDELAQRVHDIVKEDLPDVTEREVKEAITEYGKTINQSKDALEAEVRRLKREGRLELGLEDAEQGKGVKRSGLMRDEPTDRERELKRKINEELKKHPEDQADVERKWKSALDRIKTGLNNSIRDITKRIDDIQNGVAEVKQEKKAIPLDQEAELLKAQKKQLQAQLEELEGKPELSDEQRVQLAKNAAKKSIEEYQRRIDEINATGSFTEKTQKATPSTPELDALKAERDRLKEEYDNALENHGIDKIKATEQALNRKQKQLDDLTNKINKKDLGFFKKKPSKVDANDPAIKLANAQIEQAKQLLNNLREEEGIITKRKLELYRKRIADQTKSLEEEIASLKNGTWKEKVKPEELTLDKDILIERAKMDALKFDRDLLIEQERLKNRSMKEKIYETIADVMNIPKSTLASFDLSAPLRQGFVLGASHPIIASRAAREMIRHMNSEKVHEQWMHELRQTPEYRVMKEAGLYLTEPNAKLSAKEEHYSSNLIHKVPVLGEGTKMSERAYTGYLNKLRVDVFANFADMLNETTMTTAEKQANLKAYADFINNATGRGKLPKSMESGAPFLNATFFAPRYVASRVNLLGRAASGFYGLPPAARIRAIRDFGTYVGVVATTLALAKAAGAEVEADPRSSDFGKIKIGTTRYDLMAGFQQPAVLMARMFSNQTVSGGKVKELGEGYNSQTRKDVAERFLRSKMSPQAGLAYDWSKGKFFDGSKFNWKDAAFNNAAPLFFQDAYKMYQQEGVKGVAKTVPSFFGVGVQNQPEINNKTLALYPINKPMIEKMVKMDYAPSGYADNSLYKGAEILKLTSDQVDKIADLRAKYAAEAIDKASKGVYVMKIGKGDTETFTSISKMPDEELKLELNRIYKLATEKAKNQVLGQDQWNDDPIVE